MWGIPPSSLGPGLPREVPPVRPEADLPDTAPEALVCGRCRNPFDPTDPTWDGRAQYRTSGFCRRCVDRCHESTDFAHRCPVCTQQPIGGAA